MYSHPPVPLARPLNGHGLGQSPPGYRRESSQATRRGIIGESVNELEISIQDSHSCDLNTYPLLWFKYFWRKWYIQWLSFRNNLSQTSRAAVGGFWTSTSSFSQCCQVYSFHSGPTDSHHSVGDSHPGYSSNITLLLNYTGHNCFPAWRRHQQREPGEQASLLRGSGKTTASNTGCPAY